MAEGGATPPPWAERKAFGRIPLSLRRMSRMEVVGSCWVPCIRTASRYAGHCLWVGLWAPPQKKQETGFSHPSVLWKALHLPHRDLPVQETLPWPKQRQRVHRRTGRVCGRTRNTRPSIATLSGSGPLNLRRTAKFWTVSPPRCADGSRKASTTTPAQPSRTDSPERRSRGEMEGSTG